MGGLGGFLTRSEGIDLSHQPPADRGSALLAVLQVRVLATQLGELLTGVVLTAIFIGPPFQFRDLQLHPLGGGGHIGDLPA